jgi:peptidoglycan/LPS O-acetylase OafA/YrhL
MLRLDAIAYGVILAKLCRGNAALVRKPMVLLAVGLAITLEVWFQPLSLAWVPQHMMRTFELSVTPLALALCLPAATRISRLPAVGRIIYRLSLQSYSLYLVHLTALEVIEAARIHFHWSPAQSILAALVLIAGASTAITRWVELPIMALRPRQYPLLSPANKRPIHTHSVPYSPGRWTA